MSRTVWLPAAVIAVFAVACSSGDDPTASASPTPIPPQTALENARTAMANVSQFQFELTHPEGYTSLGGGLQLQRASGSVISPDKLSLDAEARVLTAFVTIKAVVISGQTWMTNPLTGQWGEVPAEDSPFKFLDPPALVSNILGQLENVSYPPEGPSSTGPIVLDGTLKAEVLQPLVGSVQAGAIVNAQLTLDRDTFRLTEARITGPLQPGDQENFVRLIKLSGFDSAITIEPPL